MALRKKIQDGPFLVGCLAYGPRALVCFPCSLRTIGSDKRLYVNQSCVFLGFKENGQDDQQSGQRPLADVGPAAALPPLKGGVFPFQACLGTRRLSHEPTIL
jgi:hypothetical protein